MKSIGGIVVNDKNVGWAKTSVTTQTGGAKTIEYQGNTDFLSEALSYIKGNERYDDISISSDPTTGTSTVTLSLNAQTALATSDAVVVPEDEVRMPTVAIVGSMASPNLHQAPFFYSNANDKLSLLAVQTIEYLLKNKGFVVASDIAQFGGMDTLYALWKCYGMDTYLAPTYTMTISYFFEASASGKTKLAQRILEAGKVWSWSKVIESIPSGVKPSDIGVPAWLANAPSISYDGDAITLTQSFTGADKFPNFYKRENEDLVYAPPALPTVAIQDIEEISSGTETETNGE